MVGRTLALALVLGLLVLAGPTRALAEVFPFEPGFFLDLPEGFTLTGGDKKTNFAFVLMPDGGLDANLFIYDGSRYPDAKSCALDLQRKLGSRGDTDYFQYEGRDSAYFQLDFGSGSQARKGFGFVCGPAPRPAGQTGKAAKGDKIVALLAYCAAYDLEAYSDFIFSYLDAFSADRAALRAPGPISQYLLPWPAQRDATKRFGFGDFAVDLPWSDEEAYEESEVTAREFRVLQAYSDEPDLAIPAWQRAYRMVYRESAARLDRVAAELDRVLPEDPTDAARRLLFWTQGFSYERDLEGADFVSPLTAAFERRGDCDSRAMVAAIILKRRGVDAILMVSSVYAHALLAVDVPGGGQRFPFAGKKWLVGETTDEVGLGMIAADQADWVNWIGIGLSP